ncbi:MULTISPECIES: TRAP transporter substrate-binding protein [unclassified Salinicola]|uniref:TRAP transporter substrate-binding protein n=1 Tax=unclassified Salinicola TaxID=2634022 RepID=UPI001A8E9464|nr:MULTISPECIES: TRAP transporter substrate-binding protein [unclassified Salinicola]MCE3027368.1 TRAP transporter substrate-binding protein [Salinicola sp. DM10]WIX34021.1 TRAP transporter substrate-binding protein [Salinicola sp. JS01]
MKTTTRTPRTLPLRRSLMSLLTAGVLGLGSLSAVAATEMPPLPEVKGDVVQGDGKDYSLKFNIGLTQSSAQYRGLEYFKKIVEQRSDGHIQVQMFHSAQLGDDLQSVSALQAGTLEMTSPSTSPMVNMFPQFAVFDLPFLFPKPEVADKVLDGEIGQRMLKEASTKGLVAIGWSENGYRQLTNSKRPVSKPSDLDGLKIRTMQNPIHLDIWRTLGANPTPMSFAELFTALEQHVVDGQENPWITIKSSKFNEVQQYATETNHVYTPFITLVSERFWNRLPADYQQLLRDAAKQMGDYERHVSRSMNDQIKQELKDEGMQITELTPAQVKVFQDKLEPVYANWRDKIGGDLIDSIRQAAASAQ